MMFTWAEAVAGGPAVCGGKGYNLGRLARYGFRVPDGGVLAASAYRLTMQHGEAGMLPDSVRCAVLDFLAGHNLADAPLAVRSSATAEDSARASFAGIHRSVLNVRGPEAVERAILECYASLSTPHARAYRNRLGFCDDDVACAVAICRMVAQPSSGAPLCAGVAFSADPRTGLRNRILIDAVAGLGDAVVSGRVTPRRFAIPLDHGRPVVEESSDIAPFASPARLQELAYTVNRIHWALGDGQDPQDIEWAHDGADLYILQSRPITALPRAGPKALVSLPQYWSRGNLKDSSPGVPCELSWSALVEIVSTVCFASLRSGGCGIDEGIELVRRFHGRGYFDFTFLQWAFFDGFGLLPEVTIRAIGGHQPLIEVPPGDPLKGPAGKRRRTASLRLLRALWGFEKKHTQRFRQHIRRMRELAGQPLASRSMADLEAMLAEIYASQLQLAPIVGLANAAAGRFMTPLEIIMQRQFGTRATALLSALSAGSGEVTSAEQGYRVTELVRIAQSDPQCMDAPEFHAAFARFLDEFGHRASIETDCGNPRWAEDPAPLLQQIRQQLAMPIAAGPRAAAKARRFAAEEEIGKRRPLLLPLIRWLARGMRRGFAIRELAKSALVAGAYPTRTILLEIGRRFTTSGHLDDARQVFDLTNSDFRSLHQGYWDGRGARELTSDRQSRREAWLREEAPDVIAGQDASLSPDFLATTPPADGAWRGTPVSPGQATGAARIVLSPDGGDALSPGDILVAPATDPGWTPLFLRASAVLMESGGYLSHGAIVAREFGLPAVVNIPGLVRQLRDGQIVRVNGDDGTVSLES